jgi:membrane dipeptidase
MERHGDIAAPALSAEDVEQYRKAGKMSGLLTFEDGRPVDGKIENLERWYKEGIRLITLTWNGDNCFGYPNSDDKALMEKGLKPFGKEAVRRMNDLGIIVDVSHLSDGGFWDAAALSKISKKPFVASHSNCRSLSPHKRNLTDEMIKALADSGGVAGLNYCPAFLNADTECKDSTLENISAHTRHLIKCGGSGCAALGSDFDGISGNLEIGSVDKVSLIFDRLREDGLSEDDIEKIAWKNALRVMKDCIP